MIYYGSIVLFYYLYHAEYRHSDCSSSYNDPIMPFIDRYERPTKPDDLPEPHTAVIQGHRSGEQWRSDVDGKTYTLQVLWKKQRFTETGEPESDGEDTEEESEQPQEAPQPPTEPEPLGPGPEAEQTQPEPQLEPEQLPVASARRWRRVTE